MVFFCWYFHEYRQNSFPVFGSWMNKDFVFHEESATKHISHAKCFTTLQPISSRTHWIFRALFFSIYLSIHSPITDSVTLFEQYHGCLALKLLQKAISLWTIDRNLLKISSGCNESWNGGVIGNFVSVVLAIHLWIFGGVINQALSRLWPHSIHAIGCFFFFGCRYLQFSSVVSCSFFCYEGNGHEFSLFTDLIWFGVAVCIFVNFFSFLFFLCFWF